MKNRRIIYLMILVMLVTSSCESSKIEILSSDICDVPCWRNISMSTNGEEAQYLLYKMDDIKKGTITSVNVSNRYWDEEINWDFAGGMYYNGNILLRQDKVVMTIIGFGNEISLSTLIDLYGNPNEVWVTKLKRGGSATVDASLMYPEKGLCFDLLVPLFLPSDPSSLEIEKDMKIMNIYLFDPKIPVDNFSTGCVWKIDESLIQQWNGYGEYDVILRE